MTIAQAISQVKSDNRAFSDDSMLTDRFIWNKIKTYTLLFTKQKSDKYNLSSDNTYSTLDCVNMELVDSTDCCKELPSCKILRSVDRLPKIADSNNGAIMKGIFTLDSGISIDYVSILDVIRMSSSRYKPQGIKAFMKDGYLFIPFRDKPKAVSVTAFFESPEEIYLINTCKKHDTCIRIQDQDWKVSSDIQGAILQEVNKELSAIFNRLQPDENTNKSEKIK